MADAPILGDQLWAVLAPESISDSVVVTDPTFKQRSQGWLDLRSCVQTASSFGVLLSHTDYKKVKKANAFQTPDEYYKSLQEHWSQAAGPVRPVVADGAQRTMEFGTNMEPLALKDYSDVLNAAYKKKHPNHTCRVDLSFPEFFIERTGVRAASPDGAVRVTFYDDETGVLNESLTEYGLVEVKAPTDGAFFRDPNRNTFLPLQKEDLRKRVKFDPYNGAKGNAKWPWDSPGRWGTWQIPKEFPVAADITPAEANWRVQNKLEVRNDDNSKRVTWFHADSELQSYYYQCIGQLFIAPERYTWVDFFPWVGSDVNPDQPYQLVRLFKDDPEVQKDWKACEDILQKEYVKHHKIYSENIKNFLAKHGKTYAVDCDVPPTLVQAPLAS
jgi:hypothetical protein